MTAPKLLSPVFKGLSGVAFLLLWALMAANGTLVALLKTAWSGVFPDGTPLKTTYTGILPIDFPLSILVAFFYGLQNRPGTPPHLMLVDLVAALLVINMMTLVESRRPNAPKWLRSSALWQYLWNCAGVALFLPIYSLLHVKHKFDEPTHPRIPKWEAQALLFSAIFSLLLPVPLLLPAALHATPPDIQVGLVQYFLTPALLVLFQTLACTALFLYASSSPSWIAQPVKAAYLLVGSASALIHLGIVSYVLWTDATSLSLVSLYLPDPTIVQAGEENILTAGALLFFQWDFIIISLTVMCHGIYLFLQRSSKFSDLVLDWRLCFGVRKMRIIG
ncbi:hypothetical protein VTI74DRAFT_3451 [Chaetomium olivicolor]